MLTYLAQFLSSLRRRAPRNYTRGGGFTLIEMLVVVAVISIITVLILFSQNKFDSSTLLRSLSYSVALSVRQAQLYGSSVKGFTTGTSQQFVSGYGVNFNKDDPTHVRMFADVNGDGCRAGDTNCTTNPASEDVATSTIGTGYKIGTACVLYLGAWYCTAYCPLDPGTTNALTPCTAISISSVTVVFRRPSSDACITDDAGFYCAVGATTVFPQALIQVSATTDSSGFDARTVKITSTGQITVCQLTSTLSAC